MILLTGATGFLGSHLLDALLDGGYDVVALKRSFSNTVRIKKQLNHKNCRYVDIDLNTPRQIFESHDITTIIHAATEYGRDHSMLTEVLETNLTLPLRLVSAGINKNLNCFINTDSYFNKGAVPFENLFNYSLSKQQLLVWLKQLSGQLKVVNMVIEHMYGPHDSESKFTANIIRQIARDQVPHIALSSGLQKRDFIYVDDVVKAYMKVIRHVIDMDYIFATFEVGTGESCELKEFPKTVKALSKSSTVLGFGEIPNRDNEIMDSKANSTTLNKIGWSPTVSLQEGISTILSEKEFTPNHRP